MATAELAFRNAEQRIFNWIKPHISALDAGINGHIGELPISINGGSPVVSERQMWMFAIVSQTETMQSNVGSPVHCHMANGTFRAMVETRETALRLVGLLRDILPASVAATVPRLAILSGMTLGRDTVELSNDQEIGGLHRVWLVEQPLFIQLSNDDEQIGYEG